jgi:hypothetical protein
MGADTGEEDDLDGGVPSIGNSRPAIDWDARSVYENADPADH